MKNKWAKQKGFTIVELLIVIVVIGILATITIVAYNGIQQRARNSARISSIQSYVKLLTLYAVQNGSYPSFTNGACFGSGYTSASCTNSTATGTIPSSATEQATFNSQLSSMGTLPDSPKINAGLTGSGNEVGAFIYNYGVTNETPIRTYRLVYFLEGTGQSCGQTRIIRETNGNPSWTGAWAVSASTSAINTNSYANITLCMVSLLNPNE